MARMSEKQARASRLLPPKRKPKGRPEPRGKAESRCTTCGMTFTGDTAESKHNTETHHNRYESVVN